MRLIRKLDIKIPASPIDYLKNELKKQGIRVGEVTGRTTTIDYSGGEPVLSRRSEAEQNKNIQVNAFNRGDLDVLILNAAGSTGISLHSDKRFKDQRKRKMFMIQPSLDINEVMQMFGRILRSGQVVKPSYEILTLSHPAEKRPTMVLSRKMRSLNANTSANAKGNVDLGVDFLNKYGDAIAAEYLMNHSEVQEKTGLELLMNEKGEIASETEDLMKKLLGKGALLSTAEQEQMYRELEEAYTEYVAELKARGDYDLELEVHDDWDVKTLSENTVLPKSRVPGKFGEQVILKTVEMKERRTIPTLDAYRNEAQHNGVLTREAARETGERLTAPIREAINAMDEKVWPGKEPDFIEARKQANRKRLQDFGRWLASCYSYSGGAETLTITAGGETYYGAISEIKVNKPDPKNPAMNSIVIRFAVGDNAGHLRVPFREIATGKVTAFSSGKNLSDVFTGEKQTVTVQRQIMTGNLVGAYEQIFDEFSSRGAIPRGKVVTYKTSNGKEETGILMPKSADMKQLVSAQENRLATWKDASRELGEVEWGEAAKQITSKDGLLTITRESGLIRFRTQYKKSLGGRYYLDETLTKLIGRDFAKRSGNMIAVLYTSEEKESPKLEKILKHLYENGVEFRKAPAEDRQYSIGGKVKDVLDKLPVEKTSIQLLEKETTS